MRSEAGKGFLPEAGETLGVFDVDKARDIFPALWKEAERKHIYFDSERGDDNADGETPQTAKRSLAAANALLKSENAGGLTLLFRGRFQGTLTVDRENTLVTGYGEERPVFEGERGAMGVVVITCSDVRVRGLEVTGQTAYRGIYCHPVRYGTLRNIVVTDCYVHDVNFLWTSPIPPDKTDPDGLILDAICPDKGAAAEYIAPFGGLTYEEDGVTHYRYNRRSHGGIVFINDTSERVGASRFENIFIEDNEVRNVARTGIYVANVWANKPGVGYGKNKFVAETEEFNDEKKGVGYFPHKNIVCSDNRVICAGGDGMILSSIVHAFAERNYCLQANYLGRTGYWNAGLWVFDAEETWFRHNESADTYMRHDSNDAQGFDLDNACRRVVFAYNYAHGNEGGGLLVCNNETTVALYAPDGSPVIGENGEQAKLTAQGRWYDNLVKNNRFERNGNLRDRTRSAFITVARESDWLFADGNTVLLRGDIEGQSVVNTEDESQECYNHYYTNNVFRSELPVNARFTAKMLKKHEAIGNEYENVVGLAEEMGNRPAAEGKE